MRNHITNSNFRIPNSAFNLEVIRLDEGPVLKTGGCRNVACEFESHDFRSEQILRSLLFYFFQTGMFAWERTRIPTPMDSVRITASLLLPYPVQSFSPLKHG